MDDHELLGALGQRAAGQDQQRAGQPERAGGEAALDDVTPVDPVDRCAIRSG